MSDRSALPFEPTFTTQSLGVRGLQSSSTATQSQLLTLEALHPLLCVLDAKTYAKSRRVPMRPKLEAKEEDEYISADAVAHSFPLQAQYLGKLVNAFVPRSLLRREVYEARHAIPAAERSGNALAIVHNGDSVALFHVVGAQKHQVALSLLPIDEVSQTLAYLTENVNVTLPRSLCDSLVAVGGNFVFGHEIGQIECVALDNDRVLVAARAYVECALFLYEPRKRHFTLAHAFVFSTALTHISFMTSVPGDLLLVTSDGSVFLYECTLAPETRCPLIESQISLRLLFDGARRADEAEAVADRKDDMEDGEVESSTKTRRLKRHARQPQVCRGYLPNTTLLLTQRSVHVLDHRDDDCHSTLLLSLSKPPFSLTPSTHLSAIANHPHVPSLFAVASDTSIFLIDQRSPDPPLYHLKHYLPEPPTSLAFLRSLERDDVYLDLLLVMSTREHSRALAYSFSTPKPPQPHHGKALDVFIRIPPSPQLNGHYTLLATFTPLSCGRKPIHTPHELRVQRDRVEEPEVSVEGGRLLLLRMELYPKSADVCFIHVTSSGDIFLQAFTHVPNRSVTAKAPQFVTPANMAPIRQLGFIPLTTIKTEDMAGLRSVMVKLAQRKSRAKPVDSVLNALGTARMKLWDFLQSQRSLTEISELFWNDHKQRISAEELKTAFLPLLEDPDTEVANLGKLFTYTLPLPAEYEAFGGGVGDSIFISTKPLLPKEGTENAGAEQEQTSTSIEATANELKIKWRSKKVELLRELRGESDTVRSRLSQSVRSTPYRPPVRSLPTVQSTPRASQSQSQFSPSQFSQFTQPRPINRTLSQLTQMTPLSFGSQLDSPGFSTPLVTRSSSILAMTPQRTSTPPSIVPSAGASSAKRKRKFSQGF